MSWLDVSRDDFDRVEDLERDQDVFLRTQEINAAVERIYNIEGSFLAFLSEKRERLAKGLPSLNENGAAKRDSKREWAKIVDNINQIPQDRLLGVNQQMVDIMFFQVRQALIDLRDICLPRGSLKRHLNLLLEGKVERGEIEVSYTTKKVRAKAKTATSRPMAPVEKVAEIIPLPKDSFLPPKPEPVNRVVGKNFVVSDQDLSGHDREIENLIEGARPDRLVQALKAKAKQMIQQNGIPSISVFSLIHSFSLGEAGSKTEISLGKVLCDVYKLSDEINRRQIRNYVKEKYEEKKMRGPIKNQLANLEIKGDKGKSSDQFPFSFLLDEGHGTSRSAIAYAMAHRPVI